MTGRDPRERRELRERRPVPPSRQQRERVLRSVVVAGVVASVGIFAVVAQARDEQLGAPGSVDQVASDGTTTELLSEELQENMEVVTGVTGLASTRGTPQGGGAGNPLMPGRGGPGRGPGAGGQPGRGGR